MERRIVGLRRKKGLGPARIAGIVQVPTSTVHRVLVRHGLNRLDHLDRVTRTPIGRMEMCPSDTCDPCRLGADKLRPSFGMPEASRSAAGQAGEDEAGDGLGQAVRFERAAGDEQFEGGDHDRAEDGRRHGGGILDFAP